MPKMSKEERSTLKNWRKDVLFNKEFELVMRLQDKGNRFVIVDKGADKIKAKQQITRSSFQELNYDPTKEHIKKVEQCSEKWFRKKEISKEWKEYIVKYDAQPGKNSTLYKTHKPDIPVRLLTPGYNTAIENLSRFTGEYSRALNTKPAKYNKQHITFIRFNP